MEALTQNTKPELTLPALKSLGELASAKPNIVVDTREAQPLIFTRFTVSQRDTLQRRLQCPWARGSLYGRTQIDWRSCRLLHWSEPRTI